VLLGFFLGLTRLVEMRCGVKLVISTDAHSTDSFQYIRFGIDQARRGWLTADDVVNTKPFATLRRALSRSATAAA
jgi:DNA polymerase (family 10)